jgi:ATP-binding cassette subfamily B protein
MTLALIRPRLLAPEVIQTSAMDCGPGALKCVLEGFHVPVSYGRLREACQTDVDGTCIDVMEELANQLGLDAEQMLLPLDYLLLRETDAFPAIVVVRAPSGNTHFVVLWRRHGGLVQVMDPAVGRRWMRASELLSTVHPHTMPVPAAAWRAWACSESFLAAIEARQKRAGVERAGRAWLERARRDPSFRTLAAIDAATRMVSALVRSGAVERGEPATRLLDEATAEAVAEVAAGRADLSIPFPYWSANPLPPEGGEERVLLRGAVLVRVRRRARTGAARQAATETLPPELARALSEAPADPLRELLRFLREDGLLTAPLVAGAALVATLATGLETLVLRGLLDIGRQLATWPERIAGIGALVVFLLGLLGLEVPLMSSALRMGRHLELRLRMAFLAKVPELGDRYFHSRPISDMSHRAHAIHTVRQLPALGFRLFRSIAQLVVTAAGLVWLEPSGAWAVACAAALSVVIPCALQSSLVERDLSVRAYQGSLTRFYLDALLGMMAVRSHGADRALRGEHERMLRDFCGSVRGLLGAAVLVEALDAVLGVALAVWLLFRYVGLGHEPAAVLLLIYWGLALPAVGHDIALSMRQYPSLRNLTLRLLEPLGAPSETDHAGEARAERSLAPSGESGVRLQFVSVSVRTAGKTILEDVNLDVPAGSHVAIVGASGAGKSSLVGLLLGWHRPAQGELLVNGAELRGERLRRLRSATAWVDPTVQLWNRSLLANLEYGSELDPPALSPVLEAAELMDTLEHLPHGLEGSLGEGGALVSGGEGQRVRLGRALLRKGARLVVLDEPFRGLDRERRSALGARARELWKGATLFCVTHDVSDTLEFPRVLVIANGRIVEDGVPRELAARTNSSYRALLDAERGARRELWRSRAWRRLLLRGGKLEEQRPEEAHADA